MPLREAFWEALRTMRAQKLKSFFSLVGVMIGMAFLIAVVAILHGMNRYMVEQFANTVVGVNTFEVRRAPNIVTSKVPEGARREWARRRPITTDDAWQVHAGLRVPAAVARYCDNVLPVHYGRRHARNAQVIAADESYIDIRHYRLAAGRAFTAQEVQAGQPVLVVGQELADKLLPNGNPLGKMVVIDAVPYRVIGIVAKQGTLFGQSLDRFAILPFTSPGRRAACSSRTAIDALIVQAADPAGMRLAMNETEAVMRSARRLRPEQANDFYLQTSEGALSTWRRISRVLMIALPGLVAMSLVVGVIVIMNIMLMAVTDRTREIGVRKALGARRRDILSQFIIESATISSVGGLFGIGLGFLLAFVTRQMTPLPAAVAPWSIPAAVTLGIGVGIAAGAYPASRAAQLDPITALRAE